MAILLLILAQATLRGYWVSNSWFLVDDFIFTSDIARGLDDAAWYLRIHQGHFMPLSFGLVKLVTLVASPFSWSLVAVEIIALQVIASLMCWWMLHTVFRRRAAVVSGLTFYLFSPLTMPTVMWWAVAINQLPYQIAFLGIIAAHIEYCRTRSTRWLVIASVFLTLGYLSYAKTGLMVLSLVTLTLIWFSFGGPWTRVTIALRRYRAAWASYGLISFIWMVVYLRQSPAVASDRPQDFLELSQSILLETFLPTIGGGPWRWIPFAEGPIGYVKPPLALVVLTVAVIAGGVGWAWATRARSLNVLWAVGIYLFASAVLVYTGRAYVLNLLGGQFVGRHLQYLSDIAPLATLAIVALFVPVAAALDPIRLRQQPIIQMKLPRVVPTIGVIAFVVGSLVSSHMYANDWRSFPAKTLTERGIAQIRDQKPLFADVGVPPTVLAGLFGDKQQIANYYAPLGDEVRTASSGSDLKMFGNDGHIRVAGIRDPASFGVYADPGPVSECLAVNTVGRWWTVPPPPSFGLWLEVIYQADVGTAMTIEIGEKEVVVAAQPGRHRALWTTTDPQATIHVTSGSDLANLCVTSVRYGSPAPVRGSS